MKPIFYIFTAIFVIWSCAKAMDAYYDQAVWLAFMASIALNAVSHLSDD